MRNVRRRIIHHRSTLSMRKVRIEPLRAMVDRGLKQLKNSRIPLGYPMSLETTTGCGHDYEDGSL